MSTRGADLEQAVGGHVGQPGAIRNVLAASFIGTVIEQYDFRLYGFAAGLVFNRLFFPSASPLVGTLSAFASFALGFVARPLGGIVCGHYGDRIGRKGMLILTLLIAGIATTLMGLLPTYATAGVWAPIALMALRIVQGFAYGGEVIGAVLMTAEYVPTARRGFYTSFIQAAGPAGLLLATLAITLAARLPEEQFLAWGWRIPFLLSIVLVFVGLFFRTQIGETPAFAKMQARGAEARVPIIEVFREQLTTVLLCAGVLFGFSVLFNTLLVFIPAYATEQLGLPAGGVLAGVAIGTLVGLIGTPIAGVLSDRFGRRPMIVAGSAFLAMYSFVFFWLIDTRGTGAIWLAFAGAFAGMALMYAPMLTFLVEHFPTRLRYSGSSGASQLGTLLGGGLAPLIATALIPASGGASWGVIVYLNAALLVTLVSALLLRETYRVDLIEMDA